jgi:hypothetical protein
LISTSEQHRRGLARPYNQAPNVRLASISSLALPCQYLQLPRAVVMCSRSSATPFTVVTRNYEHFKLAVAPPSTHGGNCFPVVEIAELLFNFLNRVQGAGHILPIRRSFLDGAVYLFELLN